MAKQVTFKVSKTGVPPVTVNWTAPESVNDKRWEELGVSQEQINDLAVDSLVIKAQGVARGSLDKGAEAVQKAVDEYKYGQRGGGGRRSVEIAADKVKEAGFTAAQIEMLKAAGVKFGDAEPAAESGKKGKAA